MGTLVGTFEKYPPLTRWVKVGQIVSEPTMYSARTHWVIDPLPPVRRDDQGASSEAINISRQLIGVVGMGLYHSMAEVQATVGRTVDPI